MSRYLANIKRDPIFSASTVKEQKVCDQFPFIKHCNQLLYVQASVVVKRSYAQTAIFYLTAATLTTYVLTRLIYLMAQKEPVLSESVSIGLSWIVIIAEIITSLLALYTRQYFRKQEIHFSEMRTEEVDEESKVSIARCRKRISYNAFTSCIRISCMDEFCAGGVHNFQDSCDRWAIVIKELPFGIPVRARERLTLEFKSIQIRVRI